MSRTKKIRDWTLTLYGYRNHMCLHASSTYNYSQSVNVRPDFSLDNVEDVEEEYNRCGGEFETLIVSGYTLDFRGRYNQPASLKVENTGMYELIDQIIDFGEKLGLATPSFATEEPWTIQYPYDEEDALYPPMKKISAYLAAIHAVARDNRQKLDVLRGKDLFTLVEDLASTKQREEDLKQELVKQQKEMVEMMAQLKEKNELISQYQSVCEQANTNMYIMREEKKALKQKMIDMVTASLANI